MKRSGKIISCLLGILIAAQVLCACAPEQGGTGLNNLTVTSADPVDKILREQEVEASAPDLFISMAKNEREGVQLILSAEKDISSYTVEVSDLVCGENKIPSGSVYVYHEKYMPLKNKVSPNKAYPNGSEIPDAILPMSAAVAAGENTVAAGQNQGVYIEVETQTETAAGIYTGTVTLTADGGVAEYPIRVEVWDFAVPSTPSVMNYLSTFSREAYGTFELDSSDEMATYYFERMLEYRMNSELPFSGIGGADAYVELLRKYYDHEGFSCYRFYYEKIACVYDGQPCPFEANLLEDYLMAVVRASVEDEKDYLSKAMFYFSNIIDEPSNAGAYQDCKEVYDLYARILKNVDKRARAELVGMENYAYYTQMVADTLLAIPCVLPEHLLATKDVLEEEYGIENITHCPMLNLFDQESSRSHYMSDDETVWWYTCGIPFYPYSSNSLDEYALGFRLMSWMQYAYGVSGYLNWAVTMQLESNYGVVVEDPYTTDRHASVPGDGYLFYPGAKYGIKGPVASLRAVAYRDGMEEYEYLKLLEDAYADKNIDAQSVLNGIYERLFTGCVPTTDTSLFRTVRSELAESILATQDPLGILYKEISVSGRSAEVVFATVSDGAEVLLGSETLVRGDDGFFRVQMDLTQETYLRVTVRSNGSEREIVRRISGTFVSLTGFEDGDTSMFRANTAAEQGILINENAAYVSEGIRSMQVTLTGRYTGTTEDLSYQPFIRLDASAINGGNLAGVESATLMMYLDGNEDLTFTIRSFVGTQYNYLGTFTAKSGWNVIRITGVASLSDVDSITGFYLMADNLLNGTEAYSRVVYIDDVSYTLQ